MGTGLKFLFERRGSYEPRDKSWQPKRQMDQFLPRWLRCWELCCILLPGRLRPGAASSAVVYLCREWHRPGGDIRGQQTRRASPPLSGRCWTNADERTEPGHFHRRPVDGHYGEDDSLDDVMEDDIVDFGDLTISQSGVLTFNESPRLRGRRWWSARGQ